MPKDGPDADIVTIADPEDAEDDGAPEASGVRWARGIPNPFNPRTVIAYEIAGTRAFAVTVAIYDVRGELVRTLVDETLAPGTYLSPWNGTDADGRSVASGVYLARVLAGSRSTTVKLALVR